MIISKLKAVGKIFQLFLLIIILTSCGEPDQDIYDLARAKQKHAIQLQRQLSEQVANSNATTGRILEEVNALTKIKTERLNNGGDWQEINAQQTVLLKEMQADTAETQRLLLELTSQVVDMSGLLGAIYSHCGEDPNVIVDNVILAPYKAHATKGKRLESLIWEKKWGYDNLVSDSRTAIECTDGIPKVEAALRAAQKLLNRD